MTERHQIQSDHPLSVSNEKLSNSIFFKKSIDLLLEILYNIDKGDGHMSKEGNAIVVQNYDIAVLNNVAELVSKVDSIVTLTKQRIEDLKLDELAPTEENKQVIRQTRADLNKEKNKYNDDIKEIDKIINRDFNELKKQVKEKILPLYADQDKLLVEKLEKITAEQIKENAEYSKTYYAAKLKSTPLRLGVRYEDIPWSFGFNSSKKSIRETCDTHFEEVEKGLMMIETHEYKDQLEVLWIKHKFDIKEALFELQQQLSMAEQIIKQRDATRIAQEKRDAELVEQKKKKTEADELTKAEAKRALEVVVEAPIVVEEYTEYTLKIEVTNSQLEKLIEFMVINDIEFDVKE